MLHTFGVQVGVVGEGGNLQAKEKSGIRRQHAQLDATARRLRHDQDFRLS